MRVLSLYDNVELPKKVAREKSQRTKVLYGCVRFTIAHMKVGQHFIVNDEKYARYASDYAKTIIKPNGESKRVAFREIPNTGAKYGVWRVA